MTNYQMFLLTVGRYLSRIFITARKRSCGKVMFSQVSMGVGVYLWSHVLSGLRYLWYQVPRGGGVGMSRRCISRGIFITTCKRSCGKVMFSQASVSLQGRGGYLWSHVLSGRGGYLWYQVPPTGCVSRGWVPTPSPRNWDLGYHASGRY